LAVPVLKLCGTAGDAARGTEIALGAAMKNRSKQGTKYTMFRPAYGLVLAPALLAGCGATSDGSEALGGEALGEVQQAVAACGGNPITPVSNYWGEQGVPRESVLRSMNAVGFLSKNSCAGAYLGNDYYLGSGSCNYAVNDNIQIGGGNYTVASIVKQRNDSTFKYALVKLVNSTVDHDVGMFRVAKRAPVVGESMGAIVGGGDFWFVGGPITATLGTTKFKNTLDSPAPTFSGAPIIDKDGYLIGIQTEDTCQGSGYNAAMRIDQILNDLPAADKAALTQNMPCSGSTPIGNTAWVGAGVTDVIRVNIDTSACGFTSTPLYFTSLTGYTSEEATGATAIYDRTNTGFRVNAQKAGITPLIANQFGFSISWTAFPPGFDDSVHHYRCAGNTPSSGWQQKDSTTIYRDVTIPASCTTNSPRYFYTSLVGSQEHRTASGVNTIYTKTESSFRIYLQRAAGITAAQAQSWGWAINWEASDKFGSGRIEAVGESSGAWYDNSPAVGTDIVNPANWGYTPRYFTSLVINNTTELPPMTGVSSIRFPWEGGASISVNRAGSTVASANSGWKLQWVARP
jgi:hypothetical protein